MQKNIEEICALLHSINSTITEVSCFLLSNEYDQNPDTQNEDEDLARLNLYLHLNAEGAKDSLRKIIHLEKEQHPNKAEKAAKLLQSIAQLEKETNKIK